MRLLRSGFSRASFTSRDPSEPLATSPKIRGTFFRPICIYLYGIALRISLSPWGEGRGEGL
jgi:hypothetical protein